MTLKTTKKLNTVPINETTNLRRSNLIESKLKTRATLLGVASLAMVFLAGCHTDMWVQPKGQTLAESDFFADGANSRPLVQHSVPVGHLKTDQEFYTGFTGGKLVNGELVDALVVDKIPYTAIKAFGGDQDKMLKRGQERFDIYCSPCHSRLGDGNGMIAQRGFSQARPPGNYHTDRLRKMPIGHFYQVVTEGYGVMYSYASRVEPADRWAIASYIRTLQISQNADPADLSPEELTQISKNEKRSDAPAPMAGGETK